MTLHSAPRLCDGRAWFDGGWARVKGSRLVAWGTGEPPAGEPPVRHGCLMPGLVDAHARLTGYFDRVLTGDVLAPHRACLALLAEAGVGAVRDVGGHVEVAPTLAASAPSGSPTVRWTGPVLDGAPVSAEATRLVADPASARRAVRLTAAEGAAWVHTGPALPADLLAVVVAEAGAHGLRVAHRPGLVDAATAAGIGVGSVQDLPRCGVLGRSAVPAKDAGLIRSWADPRTADAARETCAALARHGVALVPLLHSWRRASVLEEAVGEPRLERLVPLAPFHQYLLDMRGAGLVFGRRYARTHFGYDHLKGRARDEFEAGWRALLDCLADAYRLGVALAPGSDALGLSLVPGFALHDELEWWERAGLPREAVLALASRVPAGDPADPWGAGMLALPADPATAPSVAAALAGARFLAAPGAAGPVPAAAGRSGTEGDGR